MSQNKNNNPLLLGLGMLAGAAGALFFSKKENRAKATKVIHRAETSGKKWVNKALKDVEAFANQETLSPKKKVKISSKK